MTHIEIADGRAGRLALNVRMTAVRATQLLAALPEGNFILRLKFLRENDDDWVLEDMFDPVRTERKKGQGVIEISRDTKPGVLTGIDSMFFQNAYPVNAVAYGLYPIRDPDPANLAPWRDGDLNCVAQRVVDHFEGALRGQGLTPARRRKIQQWEIGAHEGGATIDDVAELESILKRATILRVIAGKDMYNNGNIGRVEQILSSLSTTAMLGVKIFIFPSPGKSIYTKATSGRRSVLPPTVRRKRYGCLVGVRTRTSAGSQSTSSWCRTPNL